MISNCDKLVYNSCELHYYAYQSSGTVWLLHVFDLVELNLAGMDL